MGLRAGVAHEVREEPLDQPVPADDALGRLASCRCQDDLLALASFDESVRLEPLQHLAGRGARDAQHVGHPGGEGRRILHDWAVLTDRKREEVDRLEVRVGRVTLRHRPILAAGGTCTVAG